MAGEEYCISAGAFARMCQTTRDTLRYYEKQGILVPKKSEKNGYHYYSYAQISSYYFISTFLLPRTIPPQPMLLSHISEK